MVTIRRSFALLAIAVVLALGLLGGYAIAQQPHMVNARNDLNRARNQLQMAEPDKAGHRVNALNLVNQALTEVNLGIDAGQ